MKIIINILALLLLAGCQNQKSKKMQEEKPIKPTRQKAETFDIGQYTKKVSNLVADPDKY
mgnify:CR=1 FL=1